MMIRESTARLVEMPHGLGQRCGRRPRRRGPVGRRPLRPGFLGGHELGELRRAVQAGQSHHGLHAPAGATKHHGHTPSRRQGAEHVLERVDRAHRSARERNDLVVIPQPAAIGIGRLENVRHHHAAILVGGDRGSERGVVDEPASLEKAEEVSQLIGRDRVADPDIDPAPLLERRPAVHADQPSAGVEQSTARIARVDSRIDLQAVGVLEERAGRKLIAMHAGHDSRADRRPQVGGEQKGIAGREAEITHFDEVAVGQFRTRKVVSADEFDERDVAGGIEPDEHGVVNPAIGQAALHRHAGRLHDVKIREGIAVGADEYARSAPCLTGENRDGRLRAAGDGIDSLTLRRKHRLGDVGRPA